MISYSKRFVLVKCLHGPTAKQRGGKAKEVVTNAIAIAIICKGGGGKGQQGCLEVKHSISNLLEPKKACVLVVPYFQYSRIFPLSIFTSANFLTQHGSDLKSVSSL